ncbi:unnamed protein product [Rotaria sp. Silwood2]|nr:unnamed protein product [Rotaria sp. Silwood2]CAF2753104.1 unnamed protein product [Rotaria sp. Silwood2]CAF3086755.1 unnamed protein product [Rotaria sp. Silwood2]CAF3233639.1 unnamed protein product [Rotaria sp. Silwood2]CAF4184839.1 unnamed protein product [Rotaria sp. Silwood2]
MAKSPKKLSWIEMLNESTGRDIKKEATQNNFNETQYAPMDNSDMDYNVHRSSLRISSINKSKKTNNKQQQNTLPKYTLKTTSLSSSNMSSTIKQQPFSPVAYNSFSNDFHNHNHHRSSTTPCDNEKLSSTSNNIAESSSTSTLVSASTTARTGGGPKSPEDRRRCAVCSDVASGYHYGVWSCEGCKAFFKRSIQGTNEYICPATNTCTIDKHRRKSCQACRLRRCYEVGMTKGTTRREGKYRRKAVSVCKITSTSNAAANNTNVNNQEHAASASTTNTRTATGTSSGSQPIHNSNALSSPQPQINKTTSDSTRIPIPTAEFLSILSQASRLNLLAKVDTNRPLDDQYFLQLLAKVFDQELVVLINWAKSMPGYTESLTLDQQVTIIEQSWLDTLILDIIERSLERNDDVLQFAPDFIIPRNRHLSSPVLNLICIHLFNILQVFKDPHTTHEEFIALKATILINSISTTIASTKAFRLLTNQIYQALQHTCDANPSIYHDNYIRHTTLLLQIPHIKMLSSKLIRLFLHMRSNELLPQADLLLEMLDAQDTMDISFNMNVNNLSSHTENCAPNSLINNNISSTSFEIDNSSIYSNQYPNMLTIDIDKDNMLHLPGKRSPSTPPPSFYKPISDKSTTANEHFF